MTTRIPETPSDVWALWGALPLAKLRYPILRWPQGLDPRTLARLLQGRVQQQMCTQEPVPCVDLAERRCVLGDHACTVERVYPLQKGRESWRMARVFVRWQPQSAMLDVLMLGALDEQLALHIDQVVCACFGTDARSMNPTWTTLRELCPERDGELDFQLVTPWVTGISSVGGPLPSELPQLQRYFEQALKFSLAQRGYKLTAVALDHALEWRHADVKARMRQCTASRDIAKDVLGHGLGLAWSDISSADMPGESVSTRQATGKRTTVPYRVIDGRFRLRFSKEAWPWLVLMQVCGSGENADEGWSAVNCVWA